MNREFSWSLPSLVLKKTNKGNGLFTTETIIKDEKVIIFGGYVMTLEEEKHLPRTMQDLAHQIDEFFVLGARELGEVQKTDNVNHSCEPNCGFEGQIFLVAMRDIFPDEEITFDYAMVLRGTNENDLSYEVPCLCESKSCRGMITANDWMIPELQIKYKSYFQPHIKKHIL